MMAGSFYNAMNEWMSQLALNPLLSKNKYAVSNHSSHTFIGITVIMTPEGSLWNTWSGSRVTCGFGMEICLLLEMDGWPSDGRCPFLHSGTMSHFWIKLPNLDCPEPNLSLTKETVNVRPCLSLLLSLCLQSHCKSGLPSFPFFSPAENPFASHILSLSRKWCDEMSLNWIFPSLIITTTRGKWSVSCSMGFIVTGMEWPFILSWYLNSLPLLFHH